MKTWIISLFLVAAAILVPLSTYAETPFNFPHNDALFITRIGDDHYMVVEDVGFNETQQFWAVWKFNEIKRNWELYEFGEPTPGEKRASGDYAYFSSKGVLVADIDFSTFLGCGGWYTSTAAFSATFSEPTLTLVTMDTIPPQDILELTRISGNPGEIVGEWSLELGSNSYTFTFDEDGRLIIAGDVQQCTLMKADPEIESRVPKTGQTQCWDVYGKLIDCKGTGQDGEYQIGVLPIVPPSDPYTVDHWTGPRFTDNGNGTVTDNVTGLIWLANANCFGSRDWNQALSDCNNLASGSCGLTDGSSAGDWRLPNFNELRSLINLDTSHPALPQGYAKYFTNVPTSSIAGYWTSTTDSLDQYAYTNLAFAVSIERGTVGVWFKFAPGEFAPIAVWPCRSGK